MRSRTLKALVAAAGVAALASAAVVTVPAAASDSIDGAPKARKTAEDDLPNPYSEKQRAMRRAALEKVIRGDATIQRKGDAKVVKVADDQYVQVGMQQTDQVFTILTEFGDQIDPRTGGEPGPLRNQIPEPDRREDNSTLWAEDFSRDYFMDLFFADDGESFSDFYTKQSQGRYTVDGDVSEWVQLPFNEARYGSNEIPESDGYWNYVKDSATAWYDAQLAAGKTNAQIQDYLARFDKWDRYDHDFDGNFTEPDGYIDHFQAVHAGEGEEAGGGAEGGDAIWSHRWYAFPNANAGPDGNERGGVQLGDSGFWIGDYTTEPENGGLGVFAHEYGHDLGLPDLYDTAGGENGTGFWTLMSSGSWLGHGKVDIGSTPGYMGAWDKLMLGWLDYQVASPDGDTTATLGPAARWTNNPQALVVPLPKEQITTEYNEPFSGEFEWWTGSADDLNVVLSRSIDLTGKTSATFDAKGWYEIEEGYDFLRAEVSTDAGEHWEQVGEPLDGTSGGEWVDLSWDLSDYAGQEIQFRLRYTSDGGVHLAGAMLDDIVITADGEAIFEDDVEEDGRGWDAYKWTRMNGTTTEYKGGYYLAENRQYLDYDRTLKTGPYNFSKGISQPNWVDHYPYQNGLLIWYWDERQEDNNTSEHPGEGLVLPIDARSKAVRYDNGSLVRNRLQPFDATFGIERSDPVTWTQEIERGNSVQIISAHVPERAGVATFDDSKPNRYWDARNPSNSVKVAGYGVLIDVLDQSENARQMTVRVHPAG